MCAISFKCTNTESFDLYFAVDLLGNFIPKPKPPTGKPTGVLAEGSEDGVGFIEGICISERGSLGGRTRGFLMAILDFCGEESSTDSYTCNCPKSTCV